MYGWRNYENEAWEELADDDFRCRKIEVISDFPFCDYLRSDLRYLRETYTTTPATVDRLGIST